MEPCFREQMDPEPGRPGEKAAAAQRACFHDGFTVADDGHDAFALVMEMFHLFPAYIMQDVLGGEFSFSQCHGGKRRQRMLFPGRRVA